VWNKPTKNFSGGWSGMGFELSVREVSLALRSPAMLDQIGSQSTQAFAYGR
jgi:hypothetical protein